MLKEALTLLKEIVSQRDISFLVFIISLFLLSLSINLSTFTLIVALFLKVIQVLLKRNKLYVSKTLKNAAIVGLLFFAYIIINSISQTGFNITFKSFEKQYLHCNAAEVYPQSKHCFFTVANLIALLSLFDTTIFQWTRISRHRGWCIDRRLPDRIIP